MERLFFSLVFALCSTVVQAETATQSSEDEADLTQKRYAPRALGAPAYLDETHPDHLALRKRRAMAESGEIDAAIYLPITGVTESELKKDRDRALTELKEDYTFAIKHSNRSGNNLRLELAAGSSFLESQYEIALKKLKKSASKEKIKNKGLKIK